MANFNYPDATIIKILEDGTKEFRLQKIPQEGMPAPAFYAHTLDGKTISSSELRGKVVVLNFWFIGCPACLAMEPKLKCFQGAIYRDRRRVSRDDLGSKRRCSK
jgi:thiol-disulfide isomerase/thioredoxin